MSISPGERKTRREHTDRNFNCKFINQVLGQVNEHFTDRTLGCVIPDGTVNERSTDGVNFH